MCRMFQYCPTQYCLLPGSSTLMAKWNRGFSFASHNNTLIARPVVFAKWRRDFFCADIEWSRPFKPVWCRGKKYLSCKREPRVRDCALFCFHDCSYCTSQRRLCQIVQTRTARLFWVYSGSSESRRFEAGLTRAKIDCLTVQPVARSSHNLRIHGLRR